LNAQRLQEIFVAKMDELCPLSPPRQGVRQARNDAWWSLMDKYGCKMVPSGKIADLVNNGPGDYFCIKSFNVSVVDAHWVLVPKELAEKILVLGFLP
jgi:hypothetical protein